MTPAGRTPVAAAGRAAVLAPPGGSAAAGCTVTPAGGTPPAAPPGAGRSVPVTVTESYTDLTLKSSVSHGLAEPQMCVSAGRRLYSTACAGTKYRRREPTSWHNDLKQFAASAILPDASDVRKSCAPKCKLRRIIQHTPGFECAQIDR